MITWHWMKNWLHRWSKRKVSDLSKPYPGILLILWLWNFEIAGASMLNPEISTSEISNFYFILILALPQRISRYSQRGFDDNLTRLKETSVISVVITYKTLVFLLKKGCSSKDSNTTPNAPIALSQRNPMEDFQKSSTIHNSITMALIKTAFPLICLR